MKRFMTHFKIRHPSLYRDIVITFWTGILGLPACYLTINIPHTEVFVDIRWLFGLMAFALVNRFGFAFFVAALLSFFGDHKVPTHIALFGNLAYALPFGIMIRILYRQYFSRLQNPVVFSVVWFATILLGNQLFTTPVIWTLIAFFRNQPILPFVWQGFLLQPFLIESIMVGVISALCMTSIRSHLSLKKSEEHLFTILHSIGDAVITTDSGGMVEMMNPVAETLTGWSITEAKGKPLTQIYNIVNTHTGEPVENPVLTVLEKGIVVDLANHTSLIAKDGTRRHIADSAAPIRKGSNGNIGGVVMVFRDITAEYESREAIRDSEEKYRTLFDLESDAIFLVRNEDGKILEANDSAKRLYGYCRDEFLKMANTQLSAEPEKTMAITKNPPPVVIFRKHKKKDGTIFPVEITTRLFNWRQMDVHIAAVRDITRRVEEENRRKLMESQLRQAQKMEAIGTLAGGIAHDFNNILSPIIGYTELLMDDIPPASNERKNLENILFAASRAKDLVKQILTFSRKTEHERKHVFMQSIVKESLKLMTSTIPASVKIHTDIRKTRPVMADPTHIHQVIINLCTNAWHAIPNEDGKIFVELYETTLTPENSDLHVDAKPGDYAVISVRDTGVGIDSETMKQIFEPYFSTKAIEKGTGLGLSVIHGIVREHRGFITVESSLGAGSEFRVFLPVIPAEEEKSDNISFEDLPGGIERILLVDDEKHILELMNQMLSRLGYKVTTCGDGPQAVEILQNEPDGFDLVITDMTMPNLSGEGLCIKIREIRPDLPVVLCTGYSDRIDDEKVQRLGLAGYLMKPLTKKDVAKTTRRALNGKNLK